MDAKQIKSKRIAVIMGGVSAEREVSLRTGSAVLEALLARGYDAVAIDAGQKLPAQLVECGAQVAFIAVHGRHGEDGTMQGLLEMMEIPYTGSGVLASALAIDKYVAKQMVANVVTTPPSFLVDETSDVSAICQGWTDYPQVVKPVREGSTLGISIVADAVELEAAIAAARRYDKRVLVEKFVTGREATVAVLNGQPLPVIEVVPADGFYDYAAKYTAGTTQYLVPAPLSGATYAALQDAAQRCCAKLGCRGAARVDFIVSDDAGGEFSFLEVNTIPGMTKTSLLPKAAKCAGIEFASLVELIVEDASLDR